LATLTGQLDDEQSGSADRRVAGADALDLSHAQSHIVRVLSTAQMFGGIGVAVGGTVSALIAAELATESLSGLSSTGSIVGAALIAVPVSRVMNVKGRRSGLLLAYGIGITGALLVIIGAVLEFFPLALLGLVGMGGGTTAGLQSRYAATDLATPERRGRSLAIVVWATTIGSVLGPNLSDPMGWVAEQVGLPELAGPYLLTMAALTVSAVIVATLLRPDPLLAARAAHARATGMRVAGPPKVWSVSHAARFIASIPAALLGLMAMSIGQAVMSGVMAMTPVHLKHGGADLRIIGFVISGHIAGMYVASPLVGMASDRFGRRPVILTGCAILLSAFLIAGSAGGHESEQLAVGLFLLGLGWSCTLIAGSTLLTESIPAETRPNVQGAADMIMGISGASAGLLSGLIVGLGSFALLNMLATLLVVALILFVLRPRWQLAPATR
jgi:MFS family permease